MVMMMMSRIISSRELLNIRFVDFLNVEFYDEVSFKVLSCFCMIWQLLVEVDWSVVIPSHEDTAAIVDTMHYCRCI